MSSARGIWNRVYADFLMPSRLEEYRALLSAFVDAGYGFWPIRDFWDILCQGGAPSDRRFIILRHDIDSAASTARAMWAIERELGISSTYYFRLSTLNQDLMCEIDEHGGEASYHYEELATIARRRALGGKEILKHLDEARDNFASNIQSLRTQTGLAMSTVASHGDFINRKVGVTNTVILRDPVFRSAVGVDLEAYDEEFMRHIDSRFSDTHHPRYWRAGNPLDVLPNGSHPTYLLVHPGHWHAIPWANLAADAKRVGQGAFYSFRRSLRDMASRPLPWRHRRRSSGG